MQSQQLKSDDWLRGLIRVLDQPSSEEISTDLVHFIRLYLARATIAVSPLAKCAYPEANGNVSSTAFAARQFIDEPTEDNDLRFFEAATNSYPFGPGDGCYSIDDDTDHDAADGCKTGVGFLWFVAEDVGHEQVQKYLIAEVEPWLASFENTG